VAESSVEGSIEVSVVNIDVLSAIAKSGDPIIYVGLEHVIFNE